jgi:hypothetical protein
MGLRDPDEQIDPRTQESLRTTRAFLVEHGRAEEGDPVAELGARLLEQEARFELRYATCPRCGAKNPEGVAAERADQQRTRVFGVVLYGGLAAGAWFAPKVAIVLPALDLLVFRPLGAFMLKKRGEPIRVLPLAGALALDGALIALVLLFPRAAPLIPLLALVYSLVRRPEAKEWRWEEAKKKMQFQV